MSYLSEHDGENKVVLLPTLDDILQKKRAAAQAAAQTAAQTAAQIALEEQASAAIEFVASPQDSAVTEQARRFSAQIIEEARAKAKKEADALLESARRESEQIRNSAREDGYASGRAEVFAQAADALALLDDGYRAAIQNLEHTAEQMFKQLEPYMLDTALNIAQKIMHIEFDRNDESYTAIVRHMLQNALNQKNIVLRVSDWEYQRFFSDGVGKLCAELENRKIVVEKDASLDQSECRLQSEYGDISMGIEIQLKRLGHALGANW